MHHHLTAIVPAAGQSRRMGRANKLLLPLKGKSVLEHVLDGVCAGPVNEVIVVTGHDRDRVEAVLEGYPVRAVHNPAFASGMASSIVTGIRAASRDTNGYLICLGDMPFVSPETITRLCRAHSHQSGPAIVVATTSGRRGHPVLFDRAFRKELLTLRGDVGARSVLAAHPDAVIEVDVGDDGVMQDIDTPDVYRQVSKPSVNTLPSEIRGDNLRLEDLRGGDRHDVT